MPAPIEVYDTTHAELVGRTAGRIDGLFVHLCRPTDRGFQVLEVWSTREKYEHAERELVGPILASLTAPDARRAGDSALPRVEEFALRGLVIPASGTVI
jgi:hypothetical protein